MSEDLADLTERLQRLVAQVMKETDPVKFDGLCSEIWGVLSERERLMRTQVCAKAEWSKSH